MGGQPSPNTSFLQGLSSRLRNTNSTSSSVGYPSQTSRPVGLADIFDSAGIPTGIPSGPSFGFRSAGQNFGIPTSGGVGPPSTFDINEFPSLGGSASSGSSNLIGGSAPGSNRPNYVGQLVKDAQGRNEFDKPAFDMNYNDFPALPGSNSTGIREMDSESGVGSNFSQGFGGLGNLGSGFNSTSPGSIGGSGSLGVHSTSGELFLEPGKSMESNNAHGMHYLSSPGSTSLSSIGGSSVKNQLQQQTQPQITKRGIQTTKEGRVTNIPMGMVTDQFGMIGLLTFIRVADSDPNLVSLALGTDLTNLKLDLNSSDSLYSTFPGPWSSEPLKPYEIDYQVPSEYLIHNQIKDKLALIRDKLNRYGEDILFYLFYMFPNDVLQIAASNELYVRDWRYHKDEKVWITRHPAYPPSEKTERYERGTYFYFDPQSWKRNAKEFHLDYERLESRPATVNFGNSSSSSQGVSSSNSVVAPSSGQPLVNLMS
jgi:CCR4-NOT transcription complex subunit 2